jgi:Protein of unknown function (DUF1353)
MNVQPVNAHYTGELIFKPLSDGRLMLVLQPFGFVSADQKHWQVPVGTEVDGASIPQALWSLMGGPFEGKYRDASVVHDYYCDTRIEPWKLVHQMFYEAMIVSGVSETRAKLMYAGVYFGGPRWSDTAVKNANIPRIDYDHIHFYVNHSDFDSGVFEAVAIEGKSAADVIRGSGMWASGKETQLSLRKLEKLIEADNPDILQIRQAIDWATELVEAPYLRTGEQTRTLDATGVSTVNA